MERVCNTCSAPFSRYTERRDTNSTKRIIQEEKEHHYHYGVAYHRYGICPKHHMTRLEQTKIVWINCGKCTPAQSTHTETGTTGYEELRKEVELLKKILGVRIVHT